MKGRMCKEEEGVGKKEVEERQIRRMGEEEQTNRRREKKGEEWENMMG